MISTIRAWLVAAVMLQLLCYSAQANRIHHTSTQDTAKKKLPREYIPPPGSRLPQPPVPPPTENPVAEQPQGPLVLMAGQCSFGANSSLSGRTPTFADAGRLYIDVGRPASCTGEVIRWEVCYMVQGLGTSIISAAVLRYNVRLRGYHIEDVHNIEVGQLGDSETSESVCDYIESSEPLFLQKGDLIGFVCMDNIRIALGALPSGVSGTLKVYNITIQDSGQEQQSLRSRNQGSETLLGVESVGQNQLVTFGQNVTPLLRIVMNETENNVTSSTPVPTPTMTPTPCTPDDDHNNIEFPLFTSLLTIAGVIIVILVILVCLLTYCLLRRKQNKCYKLLGCIGSCCCKRRNTVTHRITIQPITDHSMIYNELYATDDPRHIITQGRKVSTENNPAYAVADTSSDPSNPYTGLRRAAPSQDALSTATALTDVSEVPPPVASYPSDQANLSESYKGLDHTYEMIETLR